MKQSKGRPGQSWTHVIDIDHFEDRSEHACDNCIKKIRMDLEKKIHYTTYIYEVVRTQPNVELLSLYKIESVPYLSNIQLFV